jgi:hypothetical protein
MEMDKDIFSLEQSIAKIRKEFPLVPNTGAGRLSSCVRRMKAEREMDIPIEFRTGFANSTETGKASNKMTEQEWEAFYRDLSEELKRDYPELYARVFPEQGRCTTNGRSEEAVICGIV